MPDSDLFLELLQEPVAFLWIVFGAIFGGAVHDYFSGMLSVKHKGLSIPEIVGIYLGNGAKQFMHGFTVVLWLSLVPCLSSGRQKFRKA